MAAQKPIVLVGARQQELSATDTLAVGNPPPGDSSNNAATTSWVTAALGPTIGVINSGADTVTPTNGTFGTGAGAAGPYDLGSIADPRANTSDLGLIGSAVTTSIDLGIIGQ